MAGSSRRTTTSAAPGHLARRVLPTGHRTLPESSEASAQARIRWRSRPTRRGSRAGRSRWTCERHFPCPRLFQLPCPPSTPTPTPGPTLTPTATPTLTPTPTATPTPTPEPLDGNPRAASVTGTSVRVSWDRLHTVAGEIVRDVRVNYRRSASDPWTFGNYVETSQSQLGPAAYCCRRDRKRRPCQLPPVRERSVDATMWRRVERPKAAGNRAVGSDRRPQATVPRTGALTCNTEYEFQVEYKLDSGWHDYGDFTASTTAC